MKDLEKRLLKLETARPRHRQKSPEEIEQDRLLRAHIATLPGGAELIGAMDAAEPNALGFTGSLHSIVEPTEDPGGQVVGYLWKPAIEGPAVSAGKV